MPPRPRKKGNRDLVDNLYPALDRRRGVTYYRYRRPDTGEWRGLGSDKAAANRAARKLNSVLSGRDHRADRIADSIIQEGTESLGSLAARFKQHLRGITDSKGNHRAASTLDAYDRYVDKFVAHFGAETDADDVGRRAMTRYLEQYPARSYNAHRTVLRQMFALHVATSDSSTNPVEGTLPKVHKTERERLTKAEYDRIWEAATPWFRNAMDLALRSLQGRAEVAAMRFEDEREPGRLFVDRAKVEKHEAGHIRIRIGARLREVIDRCRDEILSPFMVHKRPQRQRREYLDKLEHWTQVRPEKLTREFKRLRDELGVRADLPIGQRPSFHEIRSLGGRILEEQGFTKEQIQALYGHTSEKMTRKYLDRRGREAHYTDAEAG